MSRKINELITRDARLSLTSDYIIFPLDFRDLRFTLLKNGYELAIVRNLPPAPARITYSGELARIKELTIFADSNAQQIGITSKSLENAYNSFFDLLRLINSEIGVNLFEKVKYYEIMAHYLLNTGKIPLKEIPKVENTEFIKKSSQIFGENLSSFSIRLAKKDAHINQTDWFDLAIEPDTLYENCYHIGVVFRNSNKEAIDPFVKSLEANLLSMISLVEA